MMLVLIIFSLVVSISKCHLDYRGSLYCDTIEDITCDVCFDKVNGNATAAMPHHSPIFSDAIYVSVIISISKC